MLEEAQRARLEEIQLHQEEVNRRHVKIIEYLELKCTELRRNMPFSLHSHVEHVFAE